MPRKKRVEKIGFYHIINRGVARHSTYHDDEDFLKFLDIVQEASTEFYFEIFSFCLMNNHYHFLLKTSDFNLSVSMQKINSRYSVYYNRKYKRVGPLWQGRFKSWFIYDEAYLKALVKYIEFNPIKAKITQNIGHYKWAMSSFTLSFPMLNFHLLTNTSFEELSPKEQIQLDEIYHAAVDLDANSYEEKISKPLESHFTLENNRAFSIANAIKEGYSQTEIAKHLGISKVAVSKEYAAYKHKITLFETLKTKGLFKNFHQNLSYEELNETLLTRSFLSSCTPKDKEDLTLLLPKFARIFS